MRTHFFTKGVPLLCVLLASLFACVPLFHAGAYTAHDIWHQVVRAQYYYQALMDGQLLPLWVSSLATGYGYPLFLFSYHAPWILGIIPFFLTHDVFTTLRVVYGMSVVLSGLSMFCLAAFLFKDRSVSQSWWVAACVSALYIWAPVRFFTLYVSAAMGAAYVFVFLPLAVLGILAATVPANDRLRAAGYLSQKFADWVSVGSIGVGFAGIALSHLLMCVLLMPVFGVLTIWSLWRSTNIMRTLARLISGGLLFLGFAAFYLTSTLGYARYTLSQTGQSGFNDLYKSNFVNVSQLVYSRWGFGPIISNAKDGEISFQIGIAQWAGIVLSIGVLFVLRRSFQKQTELLVILVLCWGVSVFGMTDASKPVWDVVTRYVALDYPFRLLAPAMFFATLVSGWVLWRVWATLPKGGVFMAIFLLLLAWYTNRNHVRVNLYTDVPLDLYLASETTTNTYHEYLPKWASADIFKQPYTLFTPSLSTMSKMRRTTSGFSLEYELQKTTTTRVGQFDFPGITLVIDGRNTVHNRGDGGLVEVELPAGRHTLAVVYQPPMLLLTGRWISGASVIFFVLYTAAVFRKSRAVLSPKVA
jgi:hypothetical protein